MNTIEQAVFALRYTCEHSTILKRLNGTKIPYECFARDGKKRKYRCDGKCDKAKRFISILKEPKQ